jgi:hypothetical protein
LTSCRAVAGIDAAFVGDDARLDLGRRVVEIEGDEALPRARLHFLEHALVAGVVGNHQHEVRRRFEVFAALFHRQGAARIGQRMDHHRGVLARLDDLVEVADGAGAHGGGERPVHPDGLVADDQVAPDQIGGGQVVVAGHRDQRPPQAPGHVLDEARLAAAGGALQHHRQTALRGRREDLRFVADGMVVGLGGVAHQRRGGREIGADVRLAGGSGGFMCGTYFGLVCLASSAMRFFISRSRESTCEYS